MISAEKSKLFPQIMASLAAFFGLTSEATETEIHATLEGAVPLAAQLDAARITAVADMVEIRARLSTLETEQTRLTGDLEAREIRIADLQTQIAEREDATAAILTSLRAQHQTEVSALARQVSGLKSGRPLEQEQGGDNHEAGQLREREEAGVITVDHSDLIKWGKPRHQN